MSFTPFRPDSPDWESADDLRRRCAAAAFESARGENYSPEDRADIAAELTQWALSLPTPDLRRKTGTARDVIRHIDRILTLYPVLPDALPRVSYGKLIGKASNLRRTLDRDRARDTADAAERARTDDFIPHVAGDTDPLRGTPVGARRTALDMLRMAGLQSPGGTLRRPGNTPPMAPPHGSPAAVLEYIGQYLDTDPADVPAGLLMARPVRRPDRAADPVHPGPVWTAAYASARAADGLQSADIARELDITPDTLRAHLSRSSARVLKARPGTLSEWSDALLPDAPGVKAAKTRDRAADITPRERTRDHIPNPVHCGNLRQTGHGSARAVLDHITALERAADLDPDTLRIPTDGPSWTRSLPAATRARLSHTALRNRERTTARDADTRDALRLSAGLPAVVR